MCLSDVISKCTSLNHGYFLYQPRWSPEELRSWEVPVRYGKYSIQVTSCQTWKPHPIFLLCHEIVTTRGRSDSHPPTHQLKTSWLKHLFHSIYSSSDLPVIPHSKAAFPMRIESDNKGVKLSVENFFSLRVSWCSLLRDDLEILEFKIQISSDLTVLLPGIFFPHNNYGRYIMHLILSLRKVKLKTSCVFGVDVYIITTTPHFLYPSCNKAEIVD